MLYIRPTCLKAYHAAVNNDPEANIPDWDAGTKTRTLVYSKPLDAPAVIRKLAGADTLKVVDTQVVSRQAGDGSIVISSDPIPEMAGANKFKAPVRMVFRAAESSSCEVGVLFVC